MSVEECGVGLYVIVFKESCVDVSSGVVFSLLQEVAMHSHPDFKLVWSAEIGYRMYMLLVLIKRPVTVVRWLNFGFHGLQEEKVYRSSGERYVSYSRNTYLTTR